jgi:ATP-dependent Clp protease protease subunit
MSQSDIPGPPSLIGEAGEVGERWRRNVRERLFEQRVVFLWGHLDDQLANDVAAQLMTLDATGDGAIQLNLDSPGGTLEAALCLIDVIDLLGVELHATCVGQAVGPSLGPLAVAHRRRATAHANFRLLQPVVDASGRAQDLAAWVANHRAQLDRFCARLAEAVNRPLSQLDDDFRSGRYLDAPGALEYGLIDEICASGAAVYTLSSRPLGFRPPP